MKVLLFVQTGDARPKALTTPNEYARRPDCLAGQLRAWAGKSAEFVRATNGGAFAAAFSSDHWWLVECENAEAGRGTILAVETAAIGEAFTTDFPLGRILASGGKETR